MASHSNEGAWEIPSLFWAPRYPAKDYCGRIVEGSRQLLSRSLGAVTFSSVLCANSFYIFLIRYTHRPIPKILSAGAWRFIEYCRLTENDRQEKSYTFSNISSSFHWGKQSLQLIFFFQLGLSRGISVPFNFHFSTSDARTALSWLTYKHVHYQLGCVGKCHVFYMDFQSPSEGDYVLF